VVINVLTLFPEVFHGFIHSSILKRACDRGLLQINLVNFRNWSEDKHLKVDDYPFGGGPGMVLKPEPLFRCLESLGAAAMARVILLSPQGETLKQAKAEELARAEEITILCGHYEGIDERVRRLATEEISIGDYVLTGGEAAAVVLIDCVSRLIAGVVGNSSLQQESFTGGLLEYPQYTRPRCFRGHSVPEILLNGNHQEIARWRRNEALARTFWRRPDLLRDLNWSEDDRRAIDALFLEQGCADEPGAE
jgi:tRNA (guanine37-N1)-methyltransferase